MARARWAFAAGWAGTAPAPAPPAPPAPPRKCAPPAPPRTCCRKCRRSGPRRAWAGARGGTAAGRWTGGVYPTPPWPPPSLACHCHSPRFHRRQGPLRTLWSLGAAAAAAAAIIVVMHSFHRHRRLRRLRRRHHPRYRLYLPPRAL